MEKIIEPMINIYILKILHDHNHNNDEMLLLLLKFCCSKSNAKRLGLCYSHRDEIIDDIYSEIILMAQL